MIEIGQNLNINNRRGVVCFTGNLNNTDYINVCFDDNNEYKIYKITKDGEDLILKAETDKNTISTLMAIWVSDELVSFSEEKE
mgnify:CR=1 FL=1